MSQREACPPPLRHFRALSVPLPNARRGKGEYVFTWQLGTPRSWTPCCPVSMVSIGRLPREGSEGPLLRG
eukprot:11647072-Alexandrium_andersonii.AAC.1